MNLRNVFIISVTTGAVGIAGLGLAGPAAAAGTPVTFDVVAGSLQISMPDKEVTFGHVIDTVDGSNLSTSLGGVTVTDARGASGAGVWKTTVAATDLVSTPATGTAATLDGLVAAGTTAVAGATSTVLPLGSIISAKNIGYSSGDITGGGPAKATLAFTGHTYDTSAGVPNGAIAKGEEAVRSDNTGQGNHTATWNPKVQIHIPSGTSAGTYTGIITHSVA